MTDRELLEMAAKAAGMNVPEWESTQGQSYWVPAHGFWNPLADDGDALRLAHKINASIQCRDGCEGPGHFGFFSWVEVRIGGRPQCVKEFHAQNAGGEAATRRAIVRAAAAIAQEQT